MTDWINKVHVGDCRELLRRMAADGVRVQTCVTSPPYWALRDYGVDGQIGLESTLSEWVERMVEVFRCVREVLADDGTLWLNLGDSYVGGGRGGGAENSKQRTNVGSLDAAPNAKVEGLKQKDLCGQPWRVAFALQADGWYLRSDIIWSKPNPMPESVNDRPTKSHEYLFLLSKSQCYHYDSDSIAEPRATTVGYQPVSGHADQGIHTPLAHARDKGDAKTFRAGKYVKSRIVGVGASARPVKAVPNSYDIERDSHGNKPAERLTRNRRTVWEIAPEPFHAAHFATFPRALVEPCILAGSRPGDVVLDPFMGSGTVAQVADSLGRKWVGCELNPEYAAMYGTLRQAQLGMVLA